MSTLKKILIAISPAASLLPLFASAQNPAPRAIDDIVRTVLGTLNLIISVLFVIATIVFLWGMIMYIANANDEQKREKAKGIMTWGIIGLAIMAVAWGITRILVDYFGIPTAAPIFRNPPVVTPNAAG